MIGPEVTVNVSDGSEIQPVKLFVYVNVAIPGETPVIRPELLTVAINGSELVQEPFTDGVILLVEPTQMLSGPFKLVVGVGLIVIGSLLFSEEHPVIVSWKEKVTTPSAKATTTPLAKMVTRVGSSAVHIPDEAGLK